MLDSACSTSFTRAADTLARGPSVNTSIAMMIATMISVT